MDDERRRAMNERIDAALARGDATGWFEELYSGARDEGDVPWADSQPNRHLMAWLDASGPEAAGRRALTVGAGLGDDAEALAAYGFATTAFDVAPSAVAWARRRFPGSSVDYRTADLLAGLPEDWAAAFDLVLEIYTLQALPARVRAQAADAIAGTLAPGGTLLVIASGRDLAEPAGAGPPWPLAPEELRDLFAGLELVRLEDQRTGEVPIARVLRATFRAPA